VAERTRFTPSASVGVEWLRQEAFTERGPILAASVDGMRDSRVSSRLGGALEHDFSFSRGEIAPGLGLYWNHLHSGHRFGTSYNFVDNGDAGKPYAVRSREAGDDSLEFSAYLGGRFRTMHAAWSFHGGYGMEIGADAVEHRFQVGIGADF
jgi:hypothetical protein